MALGPKPRTYRQRTPRKMIKLALRSALSDRAVRSGSWWSPNGRGRNPRRPWPATPSATLELDGRILVVLDREADEAAYKSFRNLPLVQMILTGELNAYDVLCNDWIVFTRRLFPGPGRRGPAMPRRLAADVATDVVAPSPQSVVEIAERAETSRWWRPTPRPGRGRRAPSAEEEETQ